MSFSTAEYFGCSLSSCSSGMAPLATAQTPRVIKSANRPRIKTDIKKESEEQLEAWRQELLNRFNFYDGSPVQFINKYAPSVTPPLPSPIPGNVLNMFQSLKLQKGKEVESYPSLVSSRSYYFYRWSDCLQYLQDRRFEGTRESLSSQEASLIP